MFPVCLSHAFTNQRIVAAAQGGWELQPQSRVVHLVHFYGHHLFKLFDAALYLYGLSGFIAEPFDKLLDVGYFFLLVLVCTKLLLATFCA